MYLLYHLRIEHFSHFNHQQEKYFVSLCAAELELDVNMSVTLSAEVYGFVTPGLEYRVQTTLEKAAGGFFLLTSVGFFLEAFQSVRSRLTWTLSSPAANKDLFLRGTDL